MDSQTLPLLWKYFPKVNKPLSYNSEHKKVISNAVFKVKPPDFARILRQLSGCAQKSVIYPFCMVGIPPSQPTDIRMFFFRCRLSRTFFSIARYFSQRHSPETCGSAFETSCMYLSGFFDRFEKFPFLTELGVFEVGEIAEIRVIPL